MADRKSYLHIISRRHSCPKSSAALEMQYVYRDLSDISRRIEQVLDVASGGSVQPRPFSAKEGAFRAPCKSWRACGLGSFVKRLFPKRVDFQDVMNVTADAGRS